MLSNLVGTYTFITFRKMRILLRVSSCTRNTTFTINDYLFGVNNLFNQQRRQPKNRCLWITTRVRQQITSFDIHRIKFRKTINSTS